MGSCTHSCSVWYILQCTVQSVRRDQGISQFYLYTTIPSIQYNTERKTEHTPGNQSGLFLRPRGVGNSLAFNDGICLLLHSKHNLAISQTPRPPFYFFISSFYFKFQRQPWSISQSYNYVPVYYYSTCTNLTLIKSNGSLCLEHMSGQQQSLENHLKNLYFLKLGSYISKKMRIIQLNKKILE